MTLVHLAPKTFTKCGFFKQPELLASNDIALLQQECETLLQGSAKPWSGYRQFAKSGRWQASLFAGPKAPTTLYDFLGCSKKVDSIIDELLGQPEVQNLLKSQLGDDYRLWYAMIRKIEPNGSQLRLHHDLSNEMSISILLSNTTTIDGATVFVTGSNHWPRILKYFPFLYPKRLGRFLTPAIGRPGDVYFFDNATWHGRYPARSNSHTSILLSFIPKEVGAGKRIAPNGLVNKVQTNLNKVLHG